MSVEAHIFASLAQLLTERMLNGLVDGVVLAALAWLGLKAAGKWSAGARFGVWYAVLLGAVGLPWIGLAGAVSGGGVIGTQRSVFQRSVVQRSVLLIPGSWGFYLFVIWAVVASALLGRIALGICQLRRLRKGSVRLDVGTLEPELRNLLTQSCSRNVTLYVSETQRVPVATGFFKPMIVIPAWALRELSTDQLKVTLLHEAAHLSRWDDWTNLAQKILRAIFFFHPVVWWVEGKLALEREMACDALVVAATANPRAYAECLVALAEKSLGRRAFALAQAAVSRVRHTSLRIQSILQGSHPQSVRTRKPMIALAAALTSVLLLSTGRLPRLVAFGGGSGSGVSWQATNLAAVRPAPQLASLLPGRNSPSALKGVSGEVGREVRGAALRSMLAPIGHVAVRQARSAAVSRAEVGSAIPVTHEALTVPPRPNASLQNVSFFPVFPVFPVAATETVFVVMQEQQIDAAGDRVVRINVYHLTVFYPGIDARSSAVSLSKSI